MRLDNIDQVVSDVIININLEASSIRDTIVSEADSVGYDLTDTMNAIWSESGDIGTILSNYSGKFTTTMTTLQAAIDQIKNYVADLAGVSDKEADTNISSVNSSSTTKPSTPTPQPSQPQEPQNNSGDFFIHKKDTYWKDRLQTEISIVDRLKYHDYDSSFSARASYYSAMGFSGTYIGSASQNLQMINWMKNHGYASGSKRVPTAGMFWTNENGPETIIRKSDGAILERLNSGDMVLNNKMRNNLWDFVNDPGKYLREDVLPNIETSNMAPINNEVQMNFNLPNVTNSEQFLHELQNNPKVEKVIQEITIGQISGHGKLKKYSIR